MFFIILLRRPLCVESDLPWPESVASAEIVKAGERASDAPRYLFGAMGFGALIQILKSDRGLAIFREFSQGFLAFPRWLVRPGGDAADVVHGGGIAWTTPSLSPALAGIGYIIGPELAAINTSGGVIAWWLLIPLMSLLDPLPGGTPGPAGERVLGRGLDRGLGHGGAADRGGDDAGGRLLHAVLDARVDFAFAQGRVRGLGGGGPRERGGGADRRRTFRRAGS